MHTAAHVASTQLIDERASVERQLLEPQPDRVEVPGVGDVLTALWCLNLLDVGP